MTPDEHPSSSSSAHGLAGASPNACSCTDVGHAGALMDARVSQGLATLGPNALRLMSALETKFCAWAQECGADAYSYPPLMHVSDLERFDYFQNFPHLLLCASPIRTDELSVSYAKASGEQIRVRGIPSAHLQDSQWALPSAACYNVYLHLQDQQLDDAVRITTVARCFRNESYYDELKRLWGFSMREIVCVGSPEVVQAHLQQFKPKILAFSERLGLPLTTAIATDPFFDQRASRAVMQRMFPVKEEFLYGGSLAIASVNYHRNFFGERCRIRLADGSFASSACVAFGLERWLSAMVDHFGPDVQALLKRVAEA